MPEPPAAALYWFDASVWEEQSMRWKTSHRGHDPRHLDLMAALALIIVIFAAFHFFSNGGGTPSKATFIVPSQSVRW
jgi:hypothetical protein